MTTHPSVIAVAKARHEAMRAKLISTECYKVPLLPWDALLPEIQEWLIQVEVVAIRAFLDATRERPSQYKNDEVIGSWWRFVHDQLRREVFGR